MEANIVNPKTIPWKLVRSFFVTGVLFWLLTVVALWYFVADFIDQSVLSVEQLQTIQIFLQQIGLIIVLAPLAFMIYAVVKFLRPIAGLRNKLNWILHPEVKSPEKENEPFEPEELGEFYDIECSINKLEQELLEARARIGRGEMEINTVMSGVSDAILAVDVTGRAIFFNTRFALAFGVLGSNGRGKRLAELLRDPQVIAAFQQVTTEMRSARVNFSYSLPDQEVVSHYVLSVSPLKDPESDAFFGAFGLFHDVTDFKNVERMRREFVENASHELRTPLTCIKGYVDTLLEDHKESDSDLPKFLGIISKNVNRLEIIVDDLMELANLDMGASLRCSHIQVGELTQSVFEQLQGKAEAKKIHLSMTGQTPYLFGDPSKVEQVLINLIENAIKYSPQHATIQVGWGQDKATGGVVLKVKDNGPGIAKKYQEHLFERFYRADAARSSAIEGSGLGLSIIKHIMESHGGKVSVSSEVGKGSEFVCFFPQADGTSEAMSPSVF